MELRTRTLTKTDLSRWKSALAGFQVGDVLEFRKRESAPPPVVVEPKPEEPKPEPPPVEPPPSSTGAVRIARVVPNDDSVQVTVEPFPGAGDYRIFPAEHDHQKKYSGGALTVEWNGVPETGATLIVEAVDRLGPYQYADDRTPHSQHHSVNGHGPGDSRPVVLARSEPFLVQPQRRAFSGRAVTHLHFRSPAVPKVLPVSNPVREKAWETPEVLYRASQCSPEGTRLVFHHDHLETILVDWGGVADATFLLTLRLDLPPLEPGECFHFGYEVDPHLSGRRNVGMWVTPAGEDLADPTIIWGNVNPTRSGHAWLWVVNYEGQYHYPMGFYGSDARRPLVNWQSYADQQASRRDLLGLNGTPQELDRKRRFEAFLAPDRFRLVEGEQIVRDVALARVANDPKRFPELPATFDGRLPWLAQGARVHFAHWLYHTDLDITDRATENPPGYWNTHTPHLDKRHWDNLFQEIVKAPW